MNEKELRALVHRYLIERTDFLIKKDKMSDDQMRTFIDRAITDLCYEKEIELPTELRMSLIRDIVSAMVSLGPIRSLIEDKDVTEIMINGANYVYVQRQGVIERTNVKFNSNQELTHTIQKLLSNSGSNRRVDESSPYVDFSLADGSRVNVILPPVSLTGPVMTIRKFASDITTIDDLLNRQMLNKEMAVLLISAMKAKLNVVFCGATGTGKTTALNVLSRHIPEKERIITIEDTPELRLLQEHVVTLQAKPANIEGKGTISIRDLFINSLRMRPDRIILGEVRGIEMLDLIQSISSGHAGSLAIVHAESPEDCFNRMVTMMLMSGIQLGTQEIQKQIARAIDLLAHIELFPDGVRRITNLTDIRFDKASQKTVLEDVFFFKQQNILEDGRIVGQWIKNSRCPSFYKKFAKRFVKLPDGFFSADVISEDS